MQIKWLSEEKFTTYISTKLQFLAEHKKCAKERDLGATFATNI